MLPPAACTPPRSSCVIPSSHGQPAETYAMQYCFVRYLSSRHIYGRISYQHVRVFLIVVEHLRGRIEA
jgi:hypothetical protein